VKKYVKAAISRNIEDKSVQINGGVSFGNVNESPDFNAYPMCPLAGYWTIAQGVGAGNRIANSLRVKSAHLNYILRPNPYSATTNPTCVPCEVQLMLGHVKQKPSDIPLPADISQIFQSGNSTYLPLGNLRDMIAIVNKDYWVIKKRWTEKVGFAINDGTGANATEQFIANNDFKLNVKKRINITKMMPSHFTFNDTNQTTTSKNLFFMFQAVGANGGTFGVTALPVNIEYWLDLVYEDA